MSYYNFKIIFFKCITVFFPFSLYPNDIGIPLSYIEKLWCSKRNRYEYESSLGIVLINQDNWVRVGVFNNIFNDIEKEMSTIKMIVKSFFLMFLPEEEYHVSELCFDEENNLFFIEFIFNNNSRSSLIFNRLLTITIKISKIPFIESIEFLIYD